MWKIPKHRRIHRVQVWSTHINTLNVYLGLQVLLCVDLAMTLKPGLYTFGFTYTVPLTGSYAEKTEHKVQCKRYNTFNAYLQCLSLSAGYVYCS